MEVHCPKYLKFQTNTSETPKRTKMGKTGGWTRGEEQVGSSADGAGGLSLCVPVYTSACIDNWRRLWAVTLQGVFFKNRTAGIQECAFFIFFSSLCTLHGQETCHYCAEHTEAHFNRKACLCARLKLILKYSFGAASRFTGSDTTPAERVYWETRKQNLNPARVIICFHFLSDGGYLNLPIYVITLCSAATWKAAVILWGHAGHLIPSTG